MQEEHPDPLNSPNISLDVGRTLFVKKEEKKRSDDWLPSPLLSAQRPPDHFQTKSGERPNQQL